MGIALAELASGCSIFRLEVKRQQVRDVGIRPALRQFGQNVAQVTVRFDIAGAAGEHQAIDDRAGTRTGHGVTEEPVFPIRSNLT